MNKKFYFSGLLLLSLLVSGCSTESPNDNNTNNNHEVIKYASFNILEEKGGVITLKNDLNPLKVKVGTKVEFNVTLTQGYKLDSLYVDKTNVTSSLFYVPLESKCYDVIPTFSLIDSENNGGDKEDENGGNENGDNEGANDVTINDLYKATRINQSRGSKGSIESYYEPCRGKKGAELKAALHNIIKGHETFSYSSATAAMKVMDEDPFNKNNMIFTYEGSLPKSTSYNKEHTWAKSQGRFDGKLPMHSDYHNLRPSDSGINSKRSNYDFGEVAEHNSSTKASFRATQDGNYLGKGKNTSSTVFEPKDDFKGDVARIIFYMATRYEGDNGEYDLEVNGNIPNSYNNFTSGAKGLHGNFIDLYNWMKVDPVSDIEVNRNNIIDQKYQGNRNPFIDHPEFVIMIYAKNYSGSGALNDKF